jgi:hypothetical protein
MVAREMLSRGGVHPTMSAAAQAAAREKKEVEGMDDVSEDSDAAGRHDAGPGLGCKCSHDRLAKEP